MSNSSQSEAWSSLRQRIADLVASGRTGAVEALLSEHPDLRSDEQLLLDCIYAEFCFREERDQTPQPTEYLHRYPEHAIQLQALFEVHQALETPSLLGAVADSMQQSANTPPKDEDSLLSPAVGKGTADSAAAVPRSRCSQRSDQRAGSDLRVNIQCGLVCLPQRQRHSRGSNWTTANPLRAFFYGQIAISSVRI